MKTNKAIIVGLAVALVLSVLGIFSGGQDGKDGKNGLNGVDGVGGASPEIVTYQKVHGYFSQGGNINATSTSDTTETIKATDMLEYSVVDLTPTVGATTYTLPATTTFPTISNPGDYRTWVFRNATSTATNVTIAAGTGIDLQEPDGQNVVIGQNNLAWLTCYRKADTDIVCRIDETIPAD